MSVFTKKAISDQTIGISLLVSLALPVAVQAEQHDAAGAEDKPFSSMAVSPDEREECRVPRPPVDLAKTAYLRNGYHAILRILIAERGQKTGDCSCQLDQFTWDMALESFERFQTFDNPRLPFKVLDLYAMADTLEAARAEVCTE